MSEEMNRPEAGQVEKNRHPGRSRNTPCSSNNRNTDDVGNKLFSKSDVEEIKELLERQENKIEQLERDLEEVRKKAENNQLYIQNGWTQ